MNIALRRLVIPTGAAAPNAARPPTNCDDATGDAHVDVACAYASGTPSFTLPADRSSMARAKRHAAV
ncbi:MAG: hypothetical protein IT376_04845 [Polyangiaceae bacterium]|nr:hypothetical protein [Polyangiaceae bacterium]